MNQSPLRPERVVFTLVPDPNPWDDAAALPRPGKPLSLALSLLVCLLCLYQPVYGGPDWLAPAALLLSALSAVLIIRSIASLLSAGALALLGGFVLSWEGAAYALCLVMVLSLSAYLICTLRSPWLLTLPVLCYVVALLWCGDAMLSLLPLLPLPAAGLLAYATMRNSGRVSAIVLASGMLCLCGALGFAILWFTAYGSVSLDAVLDALSAVRDELIALLEDHPATELLQEQLGEALSTLGTDAATLMRMGVEQMFHLLPALLLTPINLLSFAAQSGCSAAFRQTGLGSLVTRTSSIFSLSPLSGLIFAACTVTTMFASRQTMALSVMQNLLIILFPGMLLVGVYKFIADTKNTRSPLLIGLVVAAALFAPPFLFWGLAISGALASMLRPLITRAVLLSGKPPFGPDKPDDKNSYDDSDHDSDHDNDPT